MNSPRTAPPVCLLIITALLSLSCDKADPNAGPKSTITGKISDSAGKPLSAVTISVFGYPRGSQESFVKDTDIAGPATDYSIQVPEGGYEAPTGRVTINHNGRNYVLPLVAPDNSKDWGEQRDTSKGLKRDLIWRIAGPRPAGVGNPMDASGYFGGTVHVDKGAEIGDFVTVEITLKPDGPLFDGTAGKDVKFTRKVPFGRADEQLLLDVPLGRYFASAQITSGPKPKPLRLICSNGDPLKFDQILDRTANSVSVIFEPAEIKNGEQKLFMPKLMLFPNKGD